MGENADNGHDEIELRLYQSSTLKTSSTHPYSVFQKVVYPSGMGVGWWRVSIRSMSYNSSYNVKVHYLLHYRTNC